MDGAVNFTTILLELLPTTGMQQAAKPFACGFTSRGGATPMQTKWMKLDLDVVSGCLYVYLS